MTTKRPPNPPIIHIFVWGLVSGFVANVTAIVFNLSWQATCVLSFLLGVCAAKIMMIIWRKGE